jgi:hypothetical protein
MALHVTGVVLYYPSLAPDWVLMLSCDGVCCDVPLSLQIYLKPHAVTRELLSMIDPDGLLAQGNT